ncbi:unnamed protein product [Auanema sp. JU1783]|nr:unnamed protein product [Auanema sp. JU1783]
MSLDIPEDSPARSNPDDRVSALKANSDHDVYDCQTPSESSNNFHLDLRSRVLRGLSEPFYRNSVRSVLPKILREKRSITSSPGGKKIRCSNTMQNINQV